MSRKLMVVIIFIIVFAVIVPVNRTQALEGYYSIDVLVLMDSSNSMKDSDSNKLRFQAFKDLAEKLEIGDRISLIQFGTLTKTTIPLTEITNEETRNKLANWNIPNEGLIYTDVKKALQQGYDDIQKAFDKEHLPFVIIFTDGDIEPSGNYEKDAAFKNKYLSELKELEKKFQSNDYPIFSINLDKSGRPGDPVLKELSEATGGYLVNIKSPQNISATFQTVLESIRKKKIEEDTRVLNGENIEKGLKLKILAPSAGDFILAGNMEIQAELFIDGKQAIPGVTPDLQIEEFYLELKEWNREVIRRVLLDDGAVINGDSKMSDGIYSAMHKPESEGEIELSVIVKGEYQGTPFEIKEEVQGLSAVAVGRVMLNLSEFPEVNIIEGKNGWIEFQADVISPRTERIEFYVSSPQGISVEPAFFNLLHGKKNDIRLKIQGIDYSALDKKGELEILVRPSNADTVVSHEKLVFNYTLMPDNTFRYILSIIGLIAFGGAVYLIVRTSIMRTDHHRRWITGTLYYWNEMNSDTLHSINLGLLKKESVNLRTGSDSSDAELMTDEPIDIKIYSEKEEKLVNYYVTGGIDNILHVSDIPYKTIRLEHEMKFSVKSSFFYYDNPKLKDDIIVGTNVLKKYEAPQGNTPTKTQ